MTRLASIRRSAYFDKLSTGLLDRRFLTITALNSLTVLDVQAGGYVYDSEQNIETSEQLKYRDGLLLLPSPVVE